MNVPKIRFPEFSGEWEEKKLGEVADIIGGGTPSTKILEYWNGDIDWYSPIELENKIYLTSSRKKITKLGFEKSSARLLPVGTILFTSRAGIGKTAILKKEGTTNQGFQSIIPYERKLDSYFIFSMSNELKKYGELVGAGSTFVEVSGKQMTKMSIFLPSFQEQQKIGNFFKKLDDSISLQKDKVDNLKITKKSLLQKMFPKNGETVPEIRFPKFSGEWEEKKLGEVASFSKGNGYSKGDLTTESSIPIILYGMLYKDYKTVIEEVNSFAHIRENSVISKGNEVIIPSSGETSEDIARASVVKKAGVILGGDLNIVRLNKDIESIFLALTISNGNQKKELIKRAQGKSVVHLSNSDLKVVNLIYPTKKEQQKIGNFFKKLDKLISLNQQKLKNLETRKKALLQKMFV